MEKKEILKLCIENGFFLDRYMLEFFIGLDEKEVVGIIKRLKELKINEKILNKEVFNKYKNRVDCFLSSYNKTESGVEVLKNIKGNSGKIEAGDFVSYFRSRFEVLKDILIKKGELENFSSIRRIGKDNGVFCIIGMIYNKRVTKNKNLLLEVEDLTGRSVVLINKENKELFVRAQGLLLDDIVAFRVSGSEKMLFTSDFIYPDAKLEKERFGDKDEFIAFVSDFHVGSNKFLEGNLMRFVSWLNGEVGDSRQKTMALKVRYLIIGGDNIDGVGVYPGQEKFLKIKGCRGQYKKLVDILSLIRKDVEIIMCPGQHDAVWVGEPQLAIDKKWSGDLKGLDNLKLVSNPAMIKISGLKMLIYYGGSLNKFIDEIGDIRINYGYRCPTKVIREILKRRHLAPIYGEMDIIPNKEKDDLVLDDLPDVFVVGGQHRAMIENYNNILTISTSCWQSRTDFEEKIGNEPDPCKVPILNLKSKEVKILDFSGSEIKWESGDDLVCELGGDKK
jgi:DNA polymerase II small subunit